MERQLNEFNFTIEGQIDNIDVHTLTASLLHLNDLVAIVNSELKIDNKIKLTVKTYKPGSFDIYLQLLSDTMTLGVGMGLFNNNNIELAKNIIDTFTSVLNLKKHLGGKIPKEIKRVEGNNFEITNNSGTVIIFTEAAYKTAINPKADESIEKMFAPLYDVPYITGASIKDNNEIKSFESDKVTDFKVMMKPLSIVEQKEEITRDIEDENAILTIFSIVFDDVKKWEFYYLGDRIPVKINDESFKSAVLSRQQSILNGDRLKCILIKHQVYNEVAQVFVNKNYSISKVIDVLPPEKPQKEIFD